MVSVAAFLEKRKMLRVRKVLKILDSCHTRLADPNVESANEGTIVDVIADEIEAGEELDKEVLEDILDSNDFEIEELINETEE